MSARVQCLTLQREGGAVVGLDILSCVEGCPVPLRGTCHRAEQIDEAIRAESLAQSTDSVTVIVHVLYSRVFLEIWEKFIEKLVCARDICPVARLG